MEASAASSSSAPFSAPDAPIATTSLKAALPRLARASVEDVLAAVGRGEMASSDVLRALYPDYQGERAHIVSEPAPKDPGWFTFPKSLGLIFKPAASSSKAQPPTDVPVIGLGADLPVRFAEGGAVPGDRIVGILTPGEGVTVHRIDSPELARFENALDGWFDVRWDVDDKNARRFPARIIVVSINEPGSLAQVRGRRRRARREYREHHDDPAHRRFRRDDDRHLGLGSQAPHCHPGRNCAASPWSTAPSAPADE